MTVVLFEFITMLCASALLIVSSSVSVEAQSAALRQAKSSAETKGYVFETNHDEIVAKAKKERQLRFLSTWDSKVVEQMSKGLKKKYPFLDLTVGEHGSVESAQRFLLELKAGRGKAFRRQRDRENNSNTRQLRRTRLVRGHARNVTRAYWRICVVYWT